MSWPCRTKGALISSAPPRLIGHPITKCADELAPSHQRCAKKQSAVPAYRPSDHEVSGWVGR